MYNHVTLVRDLHMAQHKVAGLQPHQLLGILSDLASKGAPGWVTRLGQGIGCCCGDTGDVVVVLYVF